MLNLPALRTSTMPKFERVGRRVWSLYTKDIFRAIFPSDLRSLLVLLGTVGGQNRLS